MKENRVDYSKKFNQEETMVEPIVEDSQENLVEHNGEGPVFESSQAVVEQDPNELVVAKVDLDGKATHLNIRREDSISDDNIVKTVPDGEEIMAYVNQDHDDWIKIITASGVEGFALKSFVKF